MSTQELAQRNAARAVQARVSATGEVFNDFLTALDPRGESEHSKYFRFALAKSRDHRFREFLNGRTLRGTRRAIAVAKSNGRCERLVAKAVDSGTVQHDPN